MLGQNLCRRNRRIGGVIVDKAGGIEGGLALTKGGPSGIGRIGGGEQVGGGLGMELRQLGLGIDLGDGVEQLARLRQRDAARVVAVLG